MRLIYVKFIQQEILDGWTKFFGGWFVWVFFVKFSDRYSFVKIDVSFTGELYCLCTLITLMSLFICAQKL